MAGMVDGDALPYGMTTPPPESVSPDVTAGDKVPWWADQIETHELAELIRNQCDEKVCE